MRGRSRTEWLLFAALLATTWHKIAWNPFGRVMLVDILQAAFVVAVLWTRVGRRDDRLPAPAVALGGLLTFLLAAAFLSAGNIDSVEGVEQWSKGIVLLAIRVSFTVLAVATIVRGGRRLLEASLLWSVLGVAACAGWGLLQLAAHYGLGVDVDELLIKPVFAGAGTSGLIVGGTASTLDANGGLVQSAILRVPGLTNDPNHLGVLLVVPIALIGAALIVRPALLEARRRTLWLGLLVGLVLVQVTTQSRSGLLGTAVAATVVLIAERGHVRWRAVLVPCAVVGLVLGAVALTNTAFVSDVLTSRSDTGTRGAAIHREVYDLIGPVLDEHPVAGLGLNTFALYYAFRTGRSDFGPHSFFVSVLTELGLLGATAWLALIGYVALCARRLVLLGRRGSPFALALGAGIAGALAGTLAGNVFYLTMVLPYWWVLVVLAVAGRACLVRESAVESVRAVGVVTS